MLFYPRVGPPSVLADALEPITLEALLKQWRTQQFANVGVIAALHGNVTNADAEQLRKFVNDKLKPKAIVRQRTQVAELAETLVKLDLAVDHNDSTLLMYVQDPDDSFASRAKSGLLDNYCVRLIFRACVPTSTRVTWSALRSTHG